MLFSIPNVTDAEIAKYEKIRQDDPKRFEDIERAIDATAPEFVTGVTCVDDSIGTRQLYIDRYHEVKAVWGCGRWLYEYDCLSQSLTDFVADSVGRQNRAKVIATAARLAFFNPDNPPAIDKKTRLLLRLDAVENLDAPAAVAELKAIRAELEDDEQFCRALHEFGLLSMIMNLLLDDYDKPEQ